MKNIGLKNVVEHVYGLCNISYAEKFITWTLEQRWRVFRKPDWTRERGEFPEEEADCGGRTEGEGQ